MEGSALFSSCGLFERSDAMMTHPFVVGSCLNWGIEPPFQLVSAPAYRQARLVGTRARRHELQNVE